ncbi:Uncharacterised protein [Halioglobus japonicus]|nr:Uncharacterised protein [Halioglobus japonicus]
MTALELQQAIQTASNNSVADNIFVLFIYSLSIMGGAAIACHLAFRKGKAQETGGN